MKTSLFSFTVVAITLVALAAFAPRPAFAVVEHEKRVRDLVDAFNARKPDAMLELVHDDIQWLHVSGTKITLETEGKEALRESMRRYFSSCGSCKSSLEWVQTAGSRVTALERASWTSNDGCKVADELVCL